MNNIKNTILYLFIFVLIAVPVIAQTNRALIVAISDYRAECGWEGIHAVNDCKLVIPMLISNGYKQSDINTLLNEQATKANIVKELTLLAEKSKAGDYIYIQFSGHGQQMADDNGDEPDFLDEAFIPYDAFYRYTPGKYTGEEHLRDDELEYLIENIRRRIGLEGNVTVVMDACHSGTGTRIIDDDDYVRGTAYIFAPDDFEQGRINTDAFSLQLKTGSDLSPITIFSACQPDELNYEYRTGVPATYYGSLSFFFCEAVKESKSTDTNKDLYARLKNKMEAYFSKQPKKSQTPYFESTAEHKFFSISK